MATLSKNQKKVKEKIEAGKLYSVKEAAKLVKEVTFTAFDAAVDVAVRLGVDPRNADQMVRGTVTLPHGTGKEVRVLALCAPENAEAAKKAGADHVGLDEYVEKIQQGWTDVDAVVATPDVMPKIGKLGKVLGPRNLMPNPKSGTVDADIGKVVEAIKKGKLSFRVDKYGIIHVSVGRTSFSPDQLHDNVQELLNTLLRIRPSSVKGSYFRSIHLSSTMSPAIPVDKKSISGF